LLWQLHEPGHLTTQHVREAPAPPALAGLSPVHIPFSSLPVPVDLSQAALIRRVIQPSLLISVQLGHWPVVAAPTELNFNTRDYRCTAIAAIQQQFSGQFTTLPVSNLISTLPIGHISHNINFSFERWTHPAPKPTAAIGNKLCLVLHPSFTATHFCMLSSMRSSPFSSSSSSSGASLSRPPRLSSASESVYSDGSLSSSPSLPLSGSTGLSLSEFWKTRKWVTSQGASRTQSSGNIVYPCSRCLASCRSFAVLIGIFKNQNVVDASKQTNSTLKVELLSEALIWQLQRISEIDCQWMIANVAEGKRITNSPILQSHCL
jgi:hypothetical protein